MYLVARADCCWPCFDGRMKAFTANPVQKKEKVMCRPAANERKKRIFFRMPKTKNNTTSSNKFEYNLIAAIATIK